MLLLNKIFVKCDNGCNIPLTECYDHYNTCILKYKDFDISNINITNTTCEELESIKNFIEKQCKAKEFKIEQKQILKMKLDNMYLELEKDTPYEELLFNLENTKKKLDDCNVKIMKEVKKFKDENLIDINKFEVGNEYYGFKSRDQDDNEDR